MFQKSGSYCHWLGINACVLSLMIIFISTVNESLQFPIKIDNGYDSLLLLQTGHKDN